MRMALGVERFAVSLRVFDNGCGFDPHKVDLTPATGISVMRERVALVGGSLKVLSSPGKGTQVVATVPLMQPTPVERTPIVPAYQEA